MLSFKKHIQEVAEPKAGDEKRFKDKHVVDTTDEPHNDAETLKGTKKSPAKKKRLADMDQAEAEKVYEEKMMKCEDCGEEYDADKGEHECDMKEEDDKMTDSQMKKREEIVKGMKDKEADLKKRYGDRWKSVMYATATKKAMDEARSSGGSSSVKAKYNKDAVDQAIKKDPRIKGKEAKLIHSLLKGRTVKKEEVELDEAEGGIKVPAGPDHDRKVKRIQSLAKQLGAKVTKVGKSTDGKLTTIHVKGGMKVINDLMQLRTEEVELDERNKANALKKKNLDTMRGARFKLDNPNMVPKRDEKKHKTGQQHNKAIGRGLRQMEEFDLDEAFKVGAMKLKDGSSVKLAKEDVQALDNLYKNLNSSNRKKMQEKLEADKKSFGEILAFAKQAM